MIRTSKLNTKYINTSKHNKLSAFINEYKKVVSHYIDYLWSNLDETYECPKFVSTKDYKNSCLSQRAIKCASTQACGMIKASTEKVRKLIWVVNKLKKEDKDTSFLDRKIKKAKVIKPTLPKKFKCELNSICADLQKTNNFWFLQLKSIGKRFGKIRIPLCPHKQTMKWNKGKLLNSFLVSNNFVDLRFEFENKVKNKGKIVGLDQGATTCVSLSDGQVTKEDSHGWDLMKILKKLSKKKKGSKAFGRCQEHRKNYINWSINQLNLSNIKQINVEKLRNVRKGKTSCRLLSHWTYTLILDKLKRHCEEEKVSLKEQSCVYRSQRCCVCGLVRKSQRKGKIYSCVCGYVGDADMNASKNHEIELPPIDHLRHLNHNKLGFYWKPDGVFDLNGNEFTVRC